LKPGSAGFSANAPRAGMGEFIGLADNEGIKSKARIKRR